jgi:hypothetical protein
MLDYRIYKLDTSGHITGPALILFSDQDEDVIRKVQSLVDGYDVEILQGARVVTRLRLSTGRRQATRAPLAHRSFREVLAG